MGAWIHTKTRLPPMTEAENGYWYSKPVKVRRLHPSPYEVSTNKHLGVRVLRGRSPNDGRWGCGWPKVCEWYDTKAT